MVLQVIRARGDSRARADERTESDVRHLIPTPRSRKTFDVSQQLRVVAFQFDYALGPSLILRRSVLLPQERGGERLELSLGFRELDREITRIRRRRELRFQIDDALLERQHDALGLVRLILVLRGRRVVGSVEDFDRSISRQRVVNARPSPGASRRLSAVVGRAAHDVDATARARVIFPSALTLFRDSSSASYFLRSADLRDDFDDPVSSSSTLDVATFSSFDPSLGIVRSKKTDASRAGAVPRAFQRCHVMSVDGLVSRTASA